MSFLNSILKAFRYLSNIYILFIHQGKRISFYKRAQILVADTWSVLEGKGDGCFKDISSITMFADYRLPQILVHLGALKYSDELLEKLLKGLPALLRHSLSYCDLLSLCLISFTKAPFFKRKPCLLLKGHVKKNPRAIKIQAKLLFVVYTVECGYCGKLHYLDMIISEPRNKMKPKFMLHESVQH